MKKVKEEPFILSDVQYTFELSYNNNRKKLLKVTASDPYNAETIVKNKYPEVISARLLGWSQMKLRNINKEGDE